MIFPGSFAKLLAPVVAFATLSLQPRQSVFAQQLANSVVRSETGSQAGAPLTLVQAVELALRNNPLTRASAAARQLADGQLSAARARRRPILEASETVTTSNNPVFVFGSLLEQARFGPGNFQIDSLNNPDALTNFRSGLSLRIPLFDRNQSRTQIDVAKFQQQDADQQIELVAQQIRFEVLKSYYGVLLAQSRLGVAGEAVKTAEADVKRIRDMFETGLVVRSDLLAAEVQLAEFRQQKIQATGDLATSYAALNTVLAMPLTTSHRISDELSERSFTIEHSDELIRIALERRPEYARALLSVSVHSRQVRGTRDEILPKVDGFATVGASGRSPVTGSSDYTVWASVTFNIFDPGRKARLSQAKATEAMSLAEQEHVANQIQFEVARAYQQFLSARERLTVVLQTTTQAGEALRIVQDRYGAGLTTITEVLRAEMALVRARTDVLQARHDHYLAYASVLLTTGRLKDVAPFFT